MRRKKNKFHLNEVPNYFSSNVINAYSNKRAIFINGGSRVIGLILQNLGLIKEPLYSN